MPELSLSVRHTHVEVFRNLIQLPGTPFTYTSHPLLIAENPWSNEIWIRKTFYIYMLYEHLQMNCDSHALPCNDKQHRSHESRIKDLNITISFKLLE